MRAGCVVVALVVGAAMVGAAVLARGAAAQGGADGARKALEASVANFPALVLGAGTVAVPAGGAQVPPPCPAAGARVERRDGPTMAYLGAVAGEPELCRVKVGGDELSAWYGIWGKDWAGGEQAHRAIKHILQARTGDVVGFDTVAAPEAKWHDLIRHDGIEDIRLLGKVYKAVKLAHYREGFDGNVYRSVSTVWLDLATGLPIYGTYNHIAGAPELDGQLIPSAIVPGN